MSVHAVILAGGQGSRLGQVRKAELRLGGMRLIDRVTERLPVDIDSILVSSGTAPAMAARGIAIPDLDLDLAGPMAGLVAAVHTLRGHADADAVLVTLAVDTPFLPADYFSRLLAAIDDGAQAAQAAFGGNAYPTNAAWRLAALADLPERAATGTAPHSPKRLLATLGATTIDWADSHSADPFANLNTLADLVALARRARDIPA